MEQEDKESKNPKKNQRDGENLPFETIYENDHYGTIVFARSSRNNWNCAKDLQRFFRMTTTARFSLQDFQEEFKIVLRICNLKETMGLPHIFCICLPQGLIKLSSQSTAPEESCEYIHTKQHAFFIVRSDSFSA